MNNIEVVKAFMNAINAHDVDTLSKLMTENHVFNDSLGNSVTGRDKMNAGWKDYFVFCPDYWVSHEEFLERDRLVAVFGSAGGTVAAGGTLPIENKWRVAAAWLAEVEDGQVNAWRVYADNKRVHEILGRRKL